MRHSFLKDLFKIEQKPPKGLFTYEWATVGYIAFTLLLAMFTYTKLAHPEAVVFGRLRIVAVMAALWLVYRLAPCRLTRFTRAAAQLSLLPWWYADIYELNRAFPKLDWLIASSEQSFFDCQPALTLSHTLTGSVPSELMYLGYASFFPVLVLVVLYYFGWRYNEFERAMLILMGAFFAYFVLFIFIPTAGSTYYYEAVGLKNIVAGHFPNLHDYFNYHYKSLPGPGYTDGLFYHIIESARRISGRPAASRHGHHYPAAGPSRPQHQALSHSAAVLLTALRRLRLHSSPLSIGSDNRRRNGHHILFHLIIYKRAAYQKGQAV